MLLDNFDLAFKIIQSLVSDDDWDRVLEACIYVFCRELQDMKLAEKFMPLINGDANKINAFIIRLESPSPHPPLLFIFHSEQWG